MKITAIIATATAPLETLIWSICSLLLRTPAELLEEVIVSINGPDSRTGETLLQDQKQKFLEDLKALGFPVTVVRTWSRLGFSQPFEMCLPLCKTKHILFMHDDTIVVDKNWWQQIDENAAITAIKPLLAGKLLPNIWQLDKKMMRMDFPYLNTAFALINKDILQIQWTSYYMNLEIPQDSRNWNDLRKFFLEQPHAVSMMPDENLHKVIQQKCKLSCQECCSYNLFTFPVGAWAYYGAVTNNLKINTFPSNTVDHLEAMSWKEGACGEVKEPMPTALELIEEIKKSPITDVYPDFNHIVPELNGIKPLIGVIAYTRTHTIDVWLRAWNNAEHYNGKIAILHNFDGDKVPIAQKINITKHKPDFYIPRKNFEADIGAFKDLVSGKINVDYDWNVLIWFTDDIIPMRKDFLLPLLREISKPNVGLVGGWKTESNIRTVCFAIKRNLANRLVFIQDKIGLAFSQHMESGADNLSSQIQKMGFEVKLPVQAYSPKYAWDCDYEGVVDLWDKYESQF